MPTEKIRDFEVGGTKLYAKSWIPDEAPKAKVVFIHGFSDHINRYYGLFPSLAARGIEVHGFDQRGWGMSVRSNADKGATGPTSLVLSDCAAFIASHLPAADDPAPVPVFVMGHSMGGGQCIHLAASPDHGDVVHRVRGWLLETPFIGFAQGESPSSLKVALGRFVGRLLPKQKLVNKIPPEYMSRDKEVVEDVRNDELCHDTGTLEGLSGILDRSIALESGLVKLSKGQMKSLWMGLGTEDKAVSYPAAKKWFEELGDVVEDKDMKIYEGWMHQLHAEIGKEEFYKDVGDWILARVDEDKAKL